MDVFWIFEPYILLKHYSKIIPNSEMTRNEQLNALTRFAFYYIIIIFMFFNDKDKVLYGIMAIILIAVFYFIDSHVDTQKINVEIKENLKHIDNNTVFDNPINPNIGNEMDENNKILESGYIDSNGTYQIGTDYTPYSDSRIKIDEPKKCINATPDNPYKNITFNDYLDNAEKLPVPCNDDENEFDYKKMDNLYNSSIFRNTSDVYERENSQRMFYSIPQNEQGKFADWCFKGPETCKENTQACTYYNYGLWSSPRY
jgi:hypothetical protein